MERKGEELGRRAGSTGSGYTGEKILVLAVDRDDDLGSAGIRTPVVGREAVLRAALEYALARPEDSDVNVLFTALKLYDELSRRGRSVEVAVVAGHPIDTIEADLNIRRQVERLVEEHGVSGIILVSDGAEDEQVIPVIQEIAPIYSVRRVIVEQHRGVEETYILLGRYLRKAVEEPRFARLFLGVPGLVLVAFSALALVGLLWQALLVGLLITGLAMVIRGFGLEDVIAEYFSRSPLMLAIYLISSIIAGSGVAILVYSAASTPSPSLAALAEASRTTLYLLAFAASLTILGHAVHRLVQGDYRVAKEATATAIVVTLSLLTDSVLRAIAAIGENPTPAALALQLAKENFVVYAIGGVVGIIIVWRAITKIEERLVEEAEEEGGEVSAQTSSL